jgi:hypothetical protein
LGRAAALYFSLTLLLAWPLALHPGSGAMPGDPDTDLFIWTLAWNTHALTSDPLSIFDANIYHPHARTLAFSENLIGSTLFAAPVIWLTGDPLLALNVVALSSIVLSGLGAFLLARRLGLGMPAALVCGMIFAFSPARFFRLGQIHLTTMQWVPFCLAYLHTYLDRARRRDLWIAIGFFTLQAFTSGHGAVFLVVALVCVLAWRFALGEPLAPLRRLRDVGVPGALLIAPLLLLASPYRYVQEEFGLKRTLVDWETPVSSFFASLTPLHAWIFEAIGLSFEEEPSANLFPGFLVIALAAAALVIPRRPAVDGGDLRIDPPVAARAPSRLRWLAAGLTLVSVLAACVALYVHLEGSIRLRAGGTLIVSARDPWRAWVVAAAAAGSRILLARAAPFDAGHRLAWLASRWKMLAERHRLDPVPPYAILTIVGILLAAGPPFGLWPLVYDLPAFNFLRVPSRFMLLAVLGMAVLGACAFERLTGRFHGRARSLAAVAAGAMLVAECFTIPLPGYRPYSVEIPAADRWLSSQPGRLVVAELPSDYFNERRQSTYMLHSMAHWQKTVHGHSGIRTPLHHELYEKLRGFPSDASLEALASVGVTHIVIHPSMYDEPDWARASTALPAFAPRLEPVYDDGEARVYLLRPAPH